MTTDSDRRPCQGRNANVCVAEGCYGEACLRQPDPRATEARAQIVTPEPEEAHA